MTDEGRVISPRLAVRRITVGQGSLEAEVEVSPPGACSTPEMASAVREAFPNIGSHACVNEVGERFSDVMDCTPLPHVLEHVAVELQARAHAEVPGAARKVFVGTTEWADAERRRARVRMNFADDLAALRALRDAAALVNELCKRAFPDARPRLV